MNGHPPTRIIAEAGVNHNGELAVALEMVDIAAECGCDAIKFQTFKADRLVTRETPKAPYQTLYDSTPSQFEMLKALELSAEQHAAIFDRCITKGIDFLSTPFDIQSLQYLVETFDMSEIKISSGDLTNAPLLLEAARTQRPIILSTGMATLEDIAKALQVLSVGYTSPQASPSAELDDLPVSLPQNFTALNDKVTILHCVTQYPTPLEDAGLDSILVLKEAFGVPVGYSDHTTSTILPAVSVALGAILVEKHFTFDKKSHGPDHASSLEPDELLQMVAYIRDVEKTMTDRGKIPTVGELANIDCARKSLTASKPIQVGDVFTADNVTVKRPGTGISPFRYWDVIGRPSPKSYDIDETIDEV